MTIADADIRHSFPKAQQWVHHIHPLDIKKGGAPREHIDFACGFLALQEISLCCCYSFRYVLERSDFVPQVRNSIALL